MPYSVSEIHVDNKILIAGLALDKLHSRLAAKNDRPSLH